MIAGTMRAGGIAAVILVAFAASVEAAGDMEPVRVIVRLSESISDAPDLLERQGRSTKSISPDFDRLCRQYGMRRASPLRASDARIGSVDGRRAAEAAKRARLRRGSPAGAPSFASTYVLELAPDVDVEEAARAYGALDGVVYAEPDRIRRAQATTNDPFLSTSGSWGQDFDDLWGLHRVAAPAAWDAARGAGVVVAIIDSGIDTAHPDLAANVWTNPGEVAGNGVDDDGNGYVDDIYGWNAVNDSASPFDDNGHGSHVAGTVAAVADNGIGVVGVAYESRLMALKGLNANGSGFDSNLAEAILYAVDNGARVINASWGGGPGSQTLRDAIAIAHASGVVFVAGAGNDGADTDNFFPARLRTTLAVGASDHFDQIAGFSNTGIKIDVVAPGGGDAGPASIVAPHRSILSVKSAGAGAAITGGGDLIVGGLYLRQAGTSMATPHVAGAAAVILSAHPEYSVEQVRQALRQGADDIGAPGFDLESGYGRLNVAGALAVDPLEAHIASPESGTEIVGALVALTGQAGGEGFVSYRVEYANAANPEAWTMASGPVFSEVTDGLLAEIDASTWSEGNYFVRLLVDHVSGAVFEDRIRLSINRSVLTAPNDRSMYRGGGILELRGTIAPVGLLHYTAEYRISTTPATPIDYPGLGGWSEEGIVLVGGGLAPVYDGVLATLDTSIFTASTRLSFRFTITTSSGTTTRNILGVIVDPSLKNGWPVELPSSGVLLSNTNAPSVVDLDGDGHREILVSYRELVHALRSDGTNQPGWPATLERDPLEGGIFSLAYAGPSVGDVDGDGDLEVVASRGHLLHVFDRNGAYLPGWPRRFTNLFGSDCSLADLDGDGAAEILFSTRSVVRDDPHAGIHAVRADGSEMPGFPADPAAGRSQGCCYSGNLMGYGHSISVGDIDGDGSPDIVTTWTAPAGPQFGPRKMRLFAIDAQGRPKRRFPKGLGKQPFPYSQEAGPLLADLNGDGVLDVAIGKHTNLKRIHAWDGRGRRIRTAYELPRYESFRPHDRYDPLMAADVTGDGVPEVFLPTNLDADWCLLCNPPFLRDYLVAFTPAASPSGPLGGWPIAFSFTGAQKEHGAGTPAVGDIDGDGQPEIVVGTGICSGWQTGIPDCAGVWAFEPNGAVAPGFPKRTLAPNASALTSPAIADLDDDGLMEVVFLDALGRLSVYDIPGAPGPRSLPWPMARQNPAHTNALPLP